MSYWNLEGMKVFGLYMGEHKFPVTGTVELSRVAFGGEVKHHVALDEPIEVYGAIRDRVILEHGRIQRVWE
jgi:hypothetical protein